MCGSDREKLSITPLAARFPGDGIFNVEVDTFNLKFKEELKRITSEFVCSQLDCQKSKEQFGINFELQVRLAATTVEL